MPNKIIKCEIEHGRYRNKVNVTYDDGSTDLLFEYYWDELSFEEHEFIGLTEEEGMKLFTGRDIAYLRS